MPLLNIDALRVQEPVRDKLLQLSASIDFDRHAPKGANGEVFFGVNRVTRQRVAVKFYYWAGDHAYHAEPRHLASLNSENVTVVMDAAFVDENWAYFITPYFENGDLEDEISSGVGGNLRAVDLTRDILNGLSHLHAEKLVHRDLKPQNIFLSDGGGAVIGDFGSVKRIPQGHHDVPGSGHSLIYRPPESVVSDAYRTVGDIYQVGIVMYQLLGGALPYDETAWLTPKQLEHYHGLPDVVDQQIYATNIIKTTIARGQVLSLGSLPPWVCKELRRTVTKACHPNPANRFQSCSEFLGRIGRVRASVHDWRIEDGCPTRHNGATYKIVRRGDSYCVQKRRGADWRNDNSLTSANLAELVAAIDARCR